MKRKSGECVTQTVTGESYRAYLPAPLPPEPPLALDTGLLQHMDQANRALGRLDSISRVWPNSGHFLNQLLNLYVRKEAVLSSQIEGAQSSLSDLLLYELEETPGVPLDDVQESGGYPVLSPHPNPVMPLGYSRRERGLLRHPPVGEGMQSADAHALIEQIARQATDPGSPGSGAGFVGHHISHFFIAVHIVYSRLDRTGASHELDKPVKVFPDLRVGPGQAIATDQFPVLRRRACRMQFSGEIPDAFQGLWSANIQAAHGSRPYS